MVFITIEKKQSINYNNFKRFKPTCQSEFKIGEIGTT